MQDAKSVVHIDGFNADEYDWSMQNASAAAETMMVISA